MEWSDFYDYCINLVSKQFEKRTPILDIVRIVADKRNSFEHVKDRSTVFGILRESSSTPTISHISAKEIDIALINIKHSNSVMGKQTQHVEKDYLKTDVLTKRGTFYTARFGNTDLTELLFIEKKYAQQLADLDFFDIVFFSKHSKYFGVIFHPRYDAITDVLKSYSYSKDTFKTASEIYWILSQTCPCYRGSSSIAEIVSLGYLLNHGKHYKYKKHVHINALTLGVSSFSKVYRSFLSVSAHPRPKLGFIMRFNRIARDKHLTINETYEKLKKMHSKQCKRNCPPLSQDYPKAIAHIKSCLAIGGTRY